MASTINADDGVISGIAGVKTTADSTGALNIQTNGTTAISISATQAVSLTNSPTFTGGTANGVLFLNASKVATSGSALTYNGTALTSSASSAISGIFNRDTSSGATLQIQVVGNSVGTLGSDTGGNGRFDLAAVTSMQLRAAGASGYISFDANNTEQMRLTSTGLGIGTTSPASKLDVTGGFSTSTTAFTIYNNSASSASNIARIDFRVNNTFNGNERVAAVWGMNPNAAANNGGALVFGVSANGTATTPSEVGRFDQAGNLGIGTTSPGSKLEIRNDVAATTSLDTTAIKLFNNSDGGSGIEFSNGVVGKSKISFGVTSTGGGTDDTYLGFSTCVNGGTLTERARITSAGIFLVGKTSSNILAAGVELQAGGDAYFTAPGALQYLNRTGTDGTLVEFRQDNTTEGSISVSGTTVSYNGGHLSRWSQMADNTRIPLLKGTVMTNLDQMAVWEKDGQPLPNEQLNCMKVSDVEGDVNVAGVFVNWDNDDDVYTNDMNIAMTGDMIIRIAQGVVVQRGELLMSAGDGTAKPQGDDIIRSKTVAKVTSNHVTCTYDDGSYCVPCVLTAC